MTLQQLKYVVTVAEAGTITNAAKKLYISQPSLTNAIHELEKIEIVRHIDREYSMDYAVTATQKSILKAFDLAEPNVRKQAAGINEDLKSYNMKEVLNNVLSGSERS